MQNNTAGNLNTSACDDEHSSVGEDISYEHVTGNNHNHGNPSPPEMCQKKTTTNERFSPPKDFIPIESLEDRPPGPKTSAKSLGIFLFHSGIPSQCFRYLLLCLLLLGFGIFGLYNFPKFSLGPIPATYILLTLGWTLLGFVTVLAIIHGFIVFCHGHQLFYDWNFVHYVSELEVYIAIMTSLVMFLILLGFDQVQQLADTWAFGDPEVRFLFIKVSLGVLLTSLLLAIKRHYMTGLAVSFNYSNYRDRIQESLFADKMLSMLQKSRHTYKFRRKWLSKDDTALSIKQVKHPGLSDGGVLKTKPLITAQTSVRSAIDIFETSPRPATAILEDETSTKSKTGGPTLGPRSSPFKAFNYSPPQPHGFGQALPSQATSPTTAAAPIGGAATASSLQNTRSVAVYLTESEKKRQFAGFFRLANKIISKYSNVADYKSEISEEAKRTCSKLYKYLRNYERDYLLGEDFLPYIEDEAEFKRSIGLIKKYCEATAGTANLSMEEATNFAFGCAELQRAVEGILTEIYVTAKSLQTIETALDKVDSFFTLLVVLIVIIIIAIALGDAVKLLLALSTMLSGAAFAFGTSARNMFESMVFLLVIHPFDVGDRVFIPLGTTMNSLATTFASMSGVDALDNLIVSEMHLLSTVFERWDGVKLYVPNYVLAAKPIFNIRRSGPLMEMQRIHIDFTTPITKVDELRRRLEDYVKREQSDFTDIVRVVIDSIENCNRINLSIYFQHSTNWQEMEMQLARRSKILSYVKESVEALGISYLPPVQRVALVPATVTGDANLVSAGELNKLLQLAGRIDKAPAW